MLTQRRRLRRCVWVDPGRDEGVKLEVAGDLSRQTLRFAVGL